MEKFNVNACTKFSVIEELNSEFTLVKVYVMGCGKNRNMSYIAKDRVWETINEYGTDVEYLTANAVLWTGRYPDLKEAIYSDDVYFNQSMERR